MTQFRQCHCEAAPEYGVVIEDDGRVCYAYLVRGGKPVGDVWLYNSVAAPETPEWTLPDAPDRMPFLNPAGFAAGAALFDVDAAARVEWGRTRAGDIAATLFVHDEPWAVVAEGVRPGWNRFATRRGPLANPLEEHELEGKR